MCLQIVCEGEQAFPGHGFIRRVTAPQQEPRQPPPALCLSGDALCQGTDMGHRRNRIIRVVKQRSDSFMRLPTFREGQNPPPGIYLSFDITQFGKSPGKTPPADKVVGCSLHACAEVG